MKICDQEYQKMNVKTIQNSLDKFDLMHCVTVVSFRVTDYIRLLLLSGKPSFTVRPESQNASHSEFTMFKCAGEGHPPPEISWYFNDVLVNGEYCIMHMVQY